MDITAEQRKRLDEMIKQGEERLQKFPRWLSTGSLQDYDEWLVGPKRVEEIKRSVSARTITAPAQ